MQIAAQLLSEGPITPTSWSDWTKVISAQTHAKGRNLFMPLRQAITGEQAGPDMGRLLPYIGRERIMGRLNGGKI